MSYVAYMKIKGEKQGDISADASTDDSLGKVPLIPVKDNTGAISVIAFSCGVMIPGAMDTGSTGGATRIQPVTFSKYFDKSSPLLWTAITKNETLTEISCEFYRPNAKTGATEKFFTYKWKNCILVDGKAYFPNLLQKMPDSGNFLNMEDWSFTYTEAEWTHATAGSTASYPST